jgi:superfamily I DNA/RNA helicase
VDTQECLQVMCEGETSVAAVVQKMEKLFADGDAKTRITLSTTHKAKGLERERVWILRDTYLKVRPGKDGVSREEENIFYVAVTRAMKSLFLVREPKK